jgi:hypothetical protein
MNAKAVVKSARPGTKDDSGKKAKVERVEYTVPEGGFTEIPSDFSSKIHKPLKRKDFKDEALWFELRAAELEAKAKRARAEADNVRKLGGVKDRAKAKRLISMQKRMAEISEQLTAQGVDVAALLGSLSGNGEAAAPAKK